MGRRRRLHDHDVGFKGAALSVSVRYDLELTIQLRTLRSSKTGAPLSRTYFLGSSGGRRHKLVSSHRFRTDRTVRIVAVTCVVKRPAGPHHLREQ